MQELNIFMDWQLPLRPYHMAKENGGLNKLVGLEQRGGYPRWGLLPFTTDPVP